MSIRSKPLFIRAPNRTTKYFNNILSYSTTYREVGKLATQ